jgi:hypothetical protein
MKLRLVEALHRAAPFFSFIIGLGFSVLLFHRNFKTIRTAAVPLKDAEDKVVKMDGKCYRFRVEDASCENVSKE